MSNGWGTPKYGHGTTNHFNVKKGKNVYRILPPMKSCAEEGAWYKYHGIHFGWVGTDPKDPTKTRQRPFRCVKKEGRNRVVEQDCPACDLIEQQRAAFDEQKAQAIAAGKSEDEVKTICGPLEDWLKQYNLDFKCYMNAMTPTNEFGDLKVNHKFHKKGIDALFAKMNEQKIDPLDLGQGVWVEITKTTNDGNDAVDVVNEPFVMEGRTFYRAKEAPLDEALANRALSECPDLNEIGFPLTYEQVKAVVESSGEPEDIDRIFGMSQAADKPAQAPKAVAPAAAKPVAAPVAPAPAAAAKPAINPNSPEVQARLAAIRAKKDAEAKAIADAKLAEAKSKEIVKAPVVTAQDDTSNMTDEEFLAFAGNQAK